MPQEPTFERIRALAASDPEQFRKLMAQVKGTVVYPHSAQQKVLDSAARYKVMNCGRRWGKTVLAAKIIVSKTRKSNQMLWWVAPTYKVVKRGYAEVLRQLPDGVLTHPAPPESNFDAGRSIILRFKNGTRMEFYSAERPEGMLGEGVDYAVLDEAARLKADVWNETVSPTLMDRSGGALLLSTPRGRNWFYKEWLKGQDPNEPSYDSWTFPSDSNPTLPAGEVEEMRKRLPRLVADQEVDAKFIAAGSSVFMLHDKAHQDAEVAGNGLVFEFPPKGHVVLGVDLARTTDFTVLYGARMRDRRNCYFERMQAVTWPEQKRRIRRAVRTLRKAGAEHVMLIMDSTGVGDPIVEDLESEGYDVVPINFTTHKENMVRLLAKDLEEAQAFILPDGVEEFENYGMELTPRGKATYSAPDNENDDVVSAKMLQHWGIINEGFGEISVLTPEAPMAPSDPSDDDDDLGGDDFSDLVDPDDDLSDQEAAEAVGLAFPGTPSPEELLARGWF